MTSFNQFCRNKKTNKNKTNKKEKLPYMPRGATQCLENLSLNIPQRLVYVVRESRLFLFECFLDLLSAEEQYVCCEVQWKKALIRVTVQCRREARKVGILLRANFRHRITLDVHSPAAVHKAMSIVNMHCYIVFLATKDLLNKTF